MKRRRPVPKSNIILNIDQALKDDFQRALRRYRHDLNMSAAIVKFIEVFVLQINRKDPPSFPFELVGVKEVEARWNEKK